MSELSERIDAIVRSRGLFRRGQPMLIAVSGGLDSMVLLHILRQLAPISRWRLSVAHLNHRLRGRSSDADEHLVRRVCEKLVLPLMVERADVRRIATQHKLSIEMAARKARHDFLARAAASKRIPTIALAHHADDQVELFFIRLLRGSGGEGLAGMKWHNAFPRARGIEIVRPLLGESKSALREYAIANKIQFREDATNASLDILRNRIRHELLPLLRRNYQPALNKVVLRLMEIVGAEAELVKATAEGWLRQAKGRNSALAVRSFSQLPVAVQRRSLQMQLFAEGVQPDFELVEKLRLKPGESVGVEKPGAGLCLLSRDGTGLLRCQISQPSTFKSESSRIYLNGSAGKAKFSGVDMAWKNLRKAGMRLPHRRPGREYFDAELVGSNVILRHWRKGDRFQPIGASRSVKLQDLFVNQKVPRELRHRLVVAEVEKGEIFWVEGLRIAERFQLTKATKRRLQWQWRRD